MKKRLIALMLGTTITAATLTGCSEVSKGFNEIENENKIRELLEYDANTNLSKEEVENYGFKVEYEIKDGKFYISFITIKNMSPTMGGLIQDVKITYEVDKDTYYGFRHNYNLKETQHEVERVKKLTGQFDPIEVCEEDNKTVE